MQHVGKPVTGNDFLGRRSELQLLKQYLLMGQSVVLIAPRRFGKTSLVLQTLQQLKKEKYYTAFVDVFANPTLPLLAREITAEVLNNHGLKKQFTNIYQNTRALLKNIKLKATIEDFDFMLGFADQNQNEWDLFGESIDFIEKFTSKNKARMFFAFDEFGEIKKFDQNDKIIKLIRAQIQLQKNSTYIFSGSYESVMQSIFVSRKSPFYRMAHIIRLGYLEHKVLQRFFKRKTTEYNIPITHHELEAYLDISKGHPYYAQLLLQQLLLFYIIHHRIPTRDEMITELLAIEKDYLEKNWEDLSGNKEHVAVLRYLIRDSSGIYGYARKKNINAFRSLSKLENMGILYKKEKQYHFYDPLFELWIAENIN